MSRRAILQTSLCLTACSAFTWAVGVPLLSIFTMGMLAVWIALVMDTPRRLWNQQHPGSTGLHRYSWDDDSIRSESLTASVELRAGSIVGVEARRGFVFLETRGSQWRSIPVRSFVDRAQMGDLLNVAHAVADSPLSRAAAAQDRRNRHRVYVFEAVFVAGGVFLLVLMARQWR